MAKRGLGKGLQALIPSVPSLEGKGDRGQGEVVELKVESINPNRYQPRKEFDDAKLEELANSIKQHGIVQPVVVRPLGNGNYELVAGERRWRACCKLGMKTIPAIIKEMSDREATEAALIENVQREDLNPLEEAWAYRTLIEEFKLTQEEVARRVGKSRSFIANTLRLLSLPCSVQDMVSEGLLTAGHARALLAVEDSAVQEELANRVVAKGLSVRETEALVRKFKEQQTEKGEGRDSNRGARLDPVYRDIAERLESFLGTRVKIKQRGEQGKIEIDFYSQEDLGRIVELILPQEEF
ncbi:ParB/RepB/Spo0J family partition protein [Calderihabitans maritimus]|uniref:ParB-like partition protein n=1 Tax=Calderihabitans maritimus TaxID=1246530 RepID=A0A1Z5HVU4_9FIRM|nr:ParB/RepB/Spo0J family partition protein [Calderihabitans maritimus]GAW93656.1 parB-like partition protein [Calderihabitans maritimus]